MRGGDSGGDDACDSEATVVLGSGGDNPPQEQIETHLQSSTANLARGGATFLNLNLLSDERNVSLRSPI
jgi:hypothetical protein